MSDFHFNTGVLRGEMAEALLGNPEQAAWVLMEVAERGDPNELSEFCRAHDIDPAAAVAFWRRFADLVEAGGQTS